MGDLSVFKGVPCKVNVNCVGEERDFLTTSGLGSQEICLMLDGIMDPSNETELLHNIDEVMSSVQVRDSGQRP